jgi:hypothetical protein
MKRRTATLAGLLLVAIPSTIAIATTEPASTSTNSPALYPASEQVQTAPSRHHRGHHPCHRRNGAQDPAAMGQPQV